MKQDEKELKTIEFNCKYCGIIKFESMRLVLNHIEKHEREGKKK